MLQQLSKRGARPQSRVVPGPGRSARSRVVAAPVLRHVLAASAKPVKSSRISIIANAGTKTTAPAPGTSFVAAAFSSSEPVVIIGAQGEKAAALSKALLEGGLKITAGIDFPDQAKATLDFVKRYEILSRAQLNNLKTVDNDQALPKRSRVIILEGDSLGGTKTDGRYVEAAIARAMDADAAQVVLISSGSSSGGGLFSFGSSPTSPNKSLSRTEQALANSGLPYTILRVSTNSASPGDLPVRVAAGPGTIAPGAAPINTETLGQVLGSVLSQPVPAAGLPVVLEVGVAAGGLDEPAAAQIANAISEIKARNPIPEVMTAKKPAGGGLTAALGGAPLALGTISIKKALSSQDDEEDKPAARKPAPKAGTQKVATPRAAPPAKKAVASKVEEDDEEEDKKPANFFASLFGGGSSTGTLRVSTSDKPAAPAKPAAKAPPPKPAPKPAPAPPKPAAATRTGTTAVRTTGTSSVKAGTATVRVNPFSSVASRRAVEAEPAKPAQRAPPPKPAPKPAPAPAPKPAAKAPAAAPKPNPFSTVASKRALTPEPAPAKRSPSPVPPARKAAASKTPEPEEKPRQSSPGIFGFFAIAPQAAPSSPAPTSAKAPARTPAPPPKPAPKPAPAPAKPAPKPAVSARRTPEPEEAPKKQASGGFFASLFGGGKKASEEDEEVDVRSSSSRVVAKKAPAPAPAKPAPAKAVAPVKTSAPAPAKPAGNPFSTVKRSVAPAAGTGTSKTAAPSGTQRTGTQRSGTQTTKPSAPASGTVIKTPKGTYRPVSGFTVEPKKK